MATSVKITLDTRRIKKDGTFPILLRLVHNRDSRNISLDFFASLKDWNDKERIVKNSYPNSTRVNAFLQKKLAYAKRVLVDNEYRLDNLNIDEIKTLIQNFNPDAELLINKQQITFFIYTEEIIERLKKANRLGSATSYGCCLSNIKKFRNAKDFQFSELTYKFLLNYESYCLGENLKINSIGVYMRTLRAIVNLAIEDGLLIRDNYPFKNYRIKKEKTIKRAIPKAEIKKIINCEVEPDTHLWRSKKYFAMMFYMRGMNFMDLAFLKMSNIQGERVVYNRIKTKKQYIIKITQNAREIINYFTEGKQIDSDELVFPIIPQEFLLDFTKSYKRYKNRLKYFNKDIKKLANLSGIDTKVTTYVIRHSWASIAKFSGVAPSLIKDSLGHSDLQTTEAYLAEFEQEALDQVNDLIIN